MMSKRSIHSSYYNLQTGHMPAPVHVTTQPYITIFTSRGLQTLTHYSQPLIYNKLTHAFKLGYLLIVCSVRYLHWCELFIEDAISDLKVNVYSMLQHMDGWDRR